MLSHAFASRNNQNITCESLVYTDGVAMLFKAETAGLFGAQAVKEIKMVKTDSLSCSQQSYTFAMLSVPGTWLTYIYTVRFYHMDGSGARL